MQEREMTKSEKSKETRLKKKYDDSDMKASMKKQYGDDWKNVYYATIRKKAMENMRISEALKYEYMVLDQDGKVMGMSTNYRDAERNARGDNLLGITGRVVKLKRPMSQGRGDRLMGQLPADNLGEGYYEMPSIDRERYTEMPGLEGPFQTKSGKPIYYDPKEGAYYDRDTDMYLTYDEFKALDEAMTDKEVNDFHNALDKVVHKHIGHSSDEDEEKERLTKKIDEMPIPKSTMYGLVIDGKYVAKGSKRDMVAMKKKKGGTVYNAPGKKVGDSEGKVKESGIMYRAGVKKYGKEGMTKIQSAAGSGASAEEIGAIKDKYNKKKTEAAIPTSEFDYDLKKFYKKVMELEDENQHGEVAMMLVQLYGNTPEMQIIQGINGLHSMQGSIMPLQQKMRDEISTKYYKKLEQEVKDMKEGHSPHAKGTKKYKAHMAAMHANSAEPKGKMLEGMVKVTNIKWDSDDDVSDLSTTMMVPVPSGMDQDGAEEFIADYITDKTGVTHDGFRIAEGVKRNAIYQQVGKMLAKGHSMDAIKKRFDDLDKANPGYLEKIAQALKDRNEIPYDKYKSIKGAVESKVTLEDMRNALKLNESTDSNTVVAGYVRTMLNEKHNTWNKVTKEIDFVINLLEDKTADRQQVFNMLFNMNYRDDLDRKIKIKENIDKLRDIVDNKSAMAVKFADGTMKVDMTTASIFLQAYDKMKDRNQEKISQMMRTKAGFLKVLDFIYGAMK